MVVCFPEIAWQIFAGSGELRLSLFSEELEAGYNDQSQENWVEEPSSIFDRWDNWWWPSDEIIPSNTAAERYLWGNFF